MVMTREQLRRHKEQFERGNRIRKQEQFIIDRWQAAWERNLAKGIVGVTRSDLESI